MKNYIVILVAFIAGVFMFNSCEKETIGETNVNVVFDFSTIGEGTPITRASEIDEIQELFAATMPTYLPLELKSKRTGVKYTFNTGENVSIPIGDYQIKVYYGTCCEDYKRWDGAKYVTTLNQSPYNVQDGSFGYMGIMKYPLFKISNNEITINTDGNIVLKVEYDVAAIIYDNSITDYVGDYFHDRNAPGGGDGKLKCSYSAENLSLFYFIPGHVTTIILHPKPNSLYEQTKYSNVSNAKHGKYYFLKYNEVEHSDNPITGFDWTPITHGEENLE